MSNLNKTLLAIFCFLFIGSGLFILLSKVIAVYSKLPEKEVFSQKLEKKSYHNYTELLDKKEKTLGFLWDKKRNYIPLEQFSESLRLNILYAEDSTFLADYGIPLKTLFSSFTQRDNPDDSMSLTQKLAKLTFQKEKEFSFLENILLSLFLEKKLDKKEIFELYLNSIPITEKSIGLESASQEIFKKKCSKLNFHESLFLAAKRENDTPKNFYAKTTRILNELKDSKQISQHDYEYWIRRKLYQLYQKPVKSPLQQFVQKELDQIPLNLEKFGKVRIHTTLDENYTKTISNKNSFLLVDRFSGAIRSFQNELNIYEKKFLLGSSLVPLYLTFALEKGFQLSHPVNHTPYEKKIKESESPSLYEALMDANTILTDKTLSSLDREEIFEFSKGFGFPLSEKSKTFVQTKELTSFAELGKAYGVIFNKGRPLKLYLIESIQEEKTKETLFKKNLPQEKALLSQESSYIIEKALQGKHSRIAFFAEDYSSYVASSKETKSSWFIGSRSKLVIFLFREEENLSNHEDLWQNTFEEGTRLLDILPLDLEDEYTPTVSKKVSFGKSQIKNYPDRILPFKVSEEPL
jgi:membrane peptidoglycan carboxypeptidase